MYVDEWKKKRRREQRIERLQAVRASEKQIAADLRGRAMAAKVQQEVRCGEGMQAVWESGRAARVESALSQAASAKEDEGRAHRDAQSIARRQHSAATDSVASWRARTELHSALHSASLSRQQTAAENAIQTSDDLRYKQESIRRLENERSKSAVARLKQREHTETVLRQEAALRSRTREFGLQRATATPTASLSRDYKTTSFHSTLTPHSRTASTAASSSASHRASRVEVFAYTAEAEEVGANEVAVREEEIRRAEVLAEEEKVQRFQEREAQRAREVGKGMRERREEVGLEEEVAVAGRLERRERQERVVQESRLIEQQQAEMRKAATLDGMLRREFRAAFTSGTTVVQDTHSHSHSLTQGNDTAVITAKGTSALHRAVTSSEVSQHLRELFELSAAHPPAPVVLPQRELKIELAAEDNATFVVDADVADTDNADTTVANEIQHMANDTTTTAGNPEQTAEVLTASLPAADVAEEIPEAVGVEVQVEVEVVPAASVQVEEEMVVADETVAAEMSPAASPHSAENAVVAAIGDNDSFEAVERALVSDLSAPTTPPVAAVLPGAAVWGARLSQDSTNEAHEMTPQRTSSIGVVSENVRKVENLQLDIADLQGRLNGLLSLCTTPPIKERAARAAETATTAIRATTDPDVTKETVAQDEETTPLRLRRRSESPRVTFSSSPKSGGVPGMPCIVHTSRARKLSPRRTATAKSVKGRALEKGWIQGGVGFEAVSVSLGNVSEELSVELSREALQEGESLLSSSSGGSASSTVLSSDGTLSSPPTAKRAELGGGGGVLWGGTASVSPTVTTPSQIGTSPSSSTPSYSEVKVPFSTEYLSRRTALWSK